MFSLINVSLQILQVDTILSIFRGNLLPFWKHKVFSIDLLMLLNNPSDFQNQTVL